MEFLCKNGLALPKFIFDDSPKEKTYNDIPVVSSQYAELGKVDKVILGTDTYMVAMRRQLRRIDPIQRKYISITENSFFEDTNIKVPLATIAICLHRRWKYLNDIVTILEASINPPPFELLFVLNACDRETATAAGQIADQCGFTCRIVVEPEMGLSFARNRAIASCTSKWLIFLDDDAIPKRDWLHNLVSEAERVGATVAGGRSVLRWDFPRPQWYPPSLDKILSRLDYGDDTFALTPGKGHLVGANLMYRRDLFDDGVLFDTELGRKGDGLISDEETALNNHLQAKGIPVHYVGSAVVDHVVDPGRICKDWVAKRSFAQGQTRRIRYDRLPDDAAFEKETLDRVGTFWRFLSNFANYRSVDSTQWLDEFALAAGYAHEHFCRPGLSGHEKSPMQSEFWGRREFEAHFGKTISSLPKRARVIIVGGGVPSRWIYSLCVDAGHDVVAIVDDANREKLTPMAVQPFQSVPEYPADVAILATLADEDRLRNQIENAGFTGRVISWNSSKPLVTARFPTTPPSTEPAALDWPPNLEPTTAHLDKFAFSLKELSYLDCRTVAIVGDNRLTGPLLKYCRDRDYKPSVVFSIGKPENTEIDRVPVVPLADLKKSRPDALILATISRRKWMKEKIIGMRPIYDGPLVIADGSDSYEQFNDYFLPNRTIAAMHNIHAGQRAFVIGNGPSLLKTDPRLLGGDEITFGSNAIYMLDGFKPTYYFVEDRLVAEQRKDVIDALPWTKFYSGDLDYCLKNGCFINANRVPWLNFFSTDLSMGIEVGGNGQPYTMLQAAFYFGCDPIYLIGVDNTFKVPKAPDSKGAAHIFNAATDPNHFHPQYYKQGDKWNKPRVDRLEAVYRLARRTFDTYSRRIYNATLGGNLNIFERKSFNNII